MFRFLTFLTAVADRELFKNEWIKGDLYAIDGIKTALGSIACTVISAIGFGIVIFSILKNAMSGLYVVFPNLFDRIDEIKTQAVSGVSNTITEITGNKNKAIQKFGTLSVWLLGLLPNVKALTDFEDDMHDIDKKQYFLHAIPLLCAQIFIGMLIFNGYPARLANWIGSAGTYVLGAVLDNADPESTIQGLFDNVVVFSYKTSNDDSGFGKTVNGIAKKLASKMNTDFKDMSKDNKQIAVTNMENEVMKIIQSQAFTLDGTPWVDVLNDTDIYDVSYSVSTISATGAYSSGQGEVNGSSFKFYFLPEAFIHNKDHDGNLTKSNTEAFMYEVEITAKKHATSIAATNVYTLYKGIGASYQMFINPSNQENTKYVLKLTEATGIYKDNTYPCSISDLGSERVSIYFKNAEGTAIAYSGARITTDTTNPTNWIIEFEVLTSLESEWANIAYIDLVIPTKDFKFMNQPATGTLKTSKIRIHNGSETNIRVTSNTWTDVPENEIKGVELNSEVFNAKSKADAESAVGGNTTP